MPASEDTQTPEPVSWQEMAVYSSPHQASMFTPIPLYFEVRPDHRGTVLSEQVEGRNGCDV